MKLLSLILGVTSLFTACTFEGLRSPGPSGPAAWTNKNKPTYEQVARELEECVGGVKEVYEQEGESVNNARARNSECMFDKGFYLVGGYGGACSRPDNRVELPACANAPIRPQEGYYGQAISPREKLRLEREMNEGTAKYKAAVATSATLYTRSKTTFENSNQYINSKVFQDVDQCALIYKSDKSNALSSPKKGQVKAIECMLEKGYTLWEEKYVCNMPEWRDEIKVCAPYASSSAVDQKRVYDTIKAEGWPYQSFEFMNPKKKVMSEVRLDVLSCKKEPYGSPDWRNLRPQSIECMLEKGYVLTDPVAKNLCRDEDYKNKLSACQKALK
jgi:hypothetical protein